MKVVAIIFGIFFGIVLLAGVGVFMSYVSASNTATRYEATIKAKYADNRQVLANYGNKLQEAAQLTDMQAGDLVKLITASNTSRYGAGGSQAGFQMLHESLPNLDTSLYGKLMTIVEAGHDDYARNQKIILDQCRAYETQRGLFWTGTMMRLAGFPKDPDMTKYCTVVTSDYSDKAYSTGKADVIKLRPATSGQ